MTTKTKRLQELIHRTDRVLTIMHPPTAQHARIMEKAGCEAAFVGTSGVVGAYTGFADVGTATLTECVMIAGWIAQSVRFPIIMDGDTGHGGIMAVRRLVRECIRAGIAAAKGLALPGQLPIKGASSFDALALTALPKMPRDCPQMCMLGDARRDEVYFALYDRDGRRASDCRIATLEAIADEIHNPIWFVSAEIERFKKDIVSLFGGFASICETPLFPSAAPLGWLAVQRFHADGDRGDEHLEPIYLRTPQYKRV